VSETPPGDLAIVMSGGGARAAYQVGMLRWLARRHPGVRVPILTGVSAGAINAAFLASHTGPMPERIEELSQLWSGLTLDRVFRVDLWSLARNVMRLGVKLVSGGMIATPGTHAAVDTGPLWELLREALGGRHGELPGVDENLRRGDLKALAITTSSYSTGQSVTWVQGCGIPQWERPQRRSVNTRLSVRHVMASAALPIFFPAVEIDGQWYGDGGIRLVAPLAPPVHLGAGRIIAISTRYTRSAEEASRPSVASYPPPAQVIGSLFNAIFLDQFDADALTMERLNGLVAALPAGTYVPFRPVKLLVLRPTTDLARLATEHEKDLPRNFRFLTRGLGTRETRSNDLLSMVMFQPDYLKRLIDLGEKDAEARQSELDEIVEG